MNETVKWAGLLDLIKRPTIPTSCFQQWPETYFQETHKQDMRMCLPVLFSPPATDAEH